MYAYCNSVMEPWDGPAALAMTDGRWVCGGLTATVCARCAMS
jgi:glutamate synthase (NADPH) large chain